MNRLLAACLSPLLVATLLTAACGSPPPAEQEPPYRSATVEEFQSVLSQNQGPLVVAVMTASCAPCLTELPLVEALRLELPGLKVLGLSLDYSEDNLRHILERTGIGFPVYWTGEAALDPMGIRYLPLLLLYRDGGEVKRLEGLREEDELRAEFSALLGGP